MVLECMFSLLKIEINMVEQYCLDEYDSQQFFVAIRAAVYFMSTCDIIIL